MSLRFRSSKSSLSPSRLTPRVFFFCWPLEGGSAVAVLCMSVIVTKSLGLVFFSFYFKIFFFFIILIILLFQSFLSVPLKVCVS